MISLKILSTAAVMALVLPMAAPTESFAQQNGQGGKPGAARGGGAGPRVNGGGGGGQRFNGGGGPRVNGGGGGQRFGGGGGARFNGGGGGYRRGGGGGGFIPGAIAGAVIGGAIASAPYGYGGPAYAPGYYDDQYGGDDGVVAVVPAPSGGDDVSYCIQTYRSYDPRSGTYMGNDGFRHPCP